MKNKYFPSLRVGDLILHRGLYAVEELEVLEICDESVIVVLNTRNGEIDEFVVNDKMSQPNDYNNGFTITYREWA